VVTSCYNTGAITGTTVSGNVGGIAGSVAKGTVNGSVNIGIVSSASGNFGAIIGASTAQNFTDNYYLEGSAVGGNDIGTPLNDEELLAIAEEWFSDSIENFSVIEQRVYETKIVLNIYLQVGSDGIAALAADYTRTELDELADIKEKTGYLHGWRVYKTRNAVTLEKLIGDALGTTEAFTPDANYVGTAADVGGSGSGDGDPVRRMFSYGDLAAPGGFYPATKIADANAQGILPDPAGAYEVRPALAMTAVMDNIADTAGADLEAWDGEVGRNAGNARTMQLLLGTGETDYLAKIPMPNDKLLTGVDSLKVIRYADETLEQIANRLASREKEIDGLQEDANILQEKIDQISEELQQTVSDGVEQSSEKARLEDEKARLEAEKAVLQTQAAELQKQLEAEKAELESQKAALQQQLDAAKRTDLQKQPEAAKPTATVSETPAQTPAPAPTPAPASAEETSGSKAATKAEIKTVKVTFSANGGKLSVKKDGRTTKAKALTKKLTIGKKFGSLPEAARDGLYKFKGWYAKKSGGSEITKADTVSYKKDTTLYARWQARYGELNEGVQVAAVRSGKNANASVKGYVNQATKLRITEEPDNASSWYKVTYKDATGKTTTGYIYKTLVKAYWADLT
jgi:uncharacterized repeat protein (TIGR02543 family)